MIGPIVAIVAVALAVSFFCSLAEAALYSIPVSRIESLRTSGKASGRALVRLRDNIERPIAAILILNTLSHTTGASVAGAMVGHVYGNTALGIFTAVFSFVLLWITEIIPKTIGVYYANVFAPLLAGPMQFMVWILWPFVWASELTIRFLKPKGPDMNHSEEDILSVARLGLRSGAIIPEELQWVANILKINDTTCSALMTPRSVVFSVRGDLKMSDVKSDAVSWAYSRIPVTEASDLDRTVGVVMRRRVMEAIVRGEWEKTIADLMRPAHFVPESMRGHIVLQKFIDERQHLFMVVDEHGGVEGIVTLEDVLEAMLGQQIVDEFDRYTDMKELAKLKGRHRRKELKVS